MTSNLSMVAPWAEPAWINSPQSPYYTESHQRLQSYCRDYINKHVLPSSLEWEEAGEAPRTEAERYARSGIPFLDVQSKYWPKSIPRAAGCESDELDVFHLMIATDELARVEGGVLISLGGASVIGAPPIINHGTEQQKQKWLPGLFNWKTSFCLGVTEPTGGSDVANIRTTARKTPDGKFYVVNGVKKWITGALWATHMTTAVRTGGSGRNQISVLVIPLDSKGVSIEKIYNSGQNAGGSSFVDLDDVLVPVENLIGEENKGFSIIMKNFNKERFVMAVQCNRKARTCLSAAMSYANSRTTFGKFLIDNQVIRRKMSELAHRIEAHWAWIESTAFQIQTAPLKWQEPTLAGRICLLKIQGGQMLELAAREAQQVLGGAGYQKGSVGATVEQISRDLRMMVSPILRLSRSSPFRSFIANLIVIRS